MSERACDRICDRIRAERVRQVEKESYLPGADDCRVNGELALVASVLAYPHADKFDACGIEKSRDIRDCYKRKLGGRWCPVEAKQRHPRIRQLEIAAALIVAEIERLERAGQ